MKKRAMKKYIPYGDYCYGRITKVLDSGRRIQITGLCKNLVCSHTVEDFMVVPKEMGSRETMEVPCERRIYKCRYTGVKSDEDACLYDQCKICGIKESNY